MFHDVSILLLVLYKSTVVLASYIPSLMVLQYLI